MRLKVEQKKSTIGCKANQRETVRSLGLKRIGDVVIRRTVRRSGAWSTPSVTW